MKDLKQAKKALGSGTKHSRRYLKAALKIDKLDPVKDIVDNVNERDWYKSYKISCVRHPNGAVYMLCDIHDKPINGTKGKTIADVKRLMNRYPNRWYLKTAPAKAAPAAPITVPKPGPKRKIVEATQKLKRQKRKKSEK